MTSCMQYQQDRSTYIFSHGHKLEAVMDEIMFVVWRIEKSQGVDETIASHLDERPIMEYLIGERRVDVELHMVIARHPPTQII